MPAKSSSEPVDQLPPSWREWASSLLGNATAEWRFKLVLGLSLAVPFCVLYFLIGHHPVMRVHHLPLTWVDEVIGFHPYAWVWIYQSVYLPVNLIPILANRREDLWRFALGFAVISLFSFLVFVLIPIRGPQPIVSDSTGMYWLLRQYDISLNSLPSLHASLLVYCLCFGARIFHRQLPRGLWMFFATWGCLILYSTLAVKEHYAVDIASGVVLALGVHFWIWRRHDINVTSRKVRVDQGTEPVVVNNQPPRSESG